MILSAFKWSYAVVSSVVNWWIRVMDRRDMMRGAMRGYTRRLLMIEATPTTLSQSSHTMTQESEATYTYSTVS